MELLVWNCHHEGFAIIISAPLGGCVMWTRKKSGRKEAGNVEVVEGGESKVNKKVASFKNDT